MKRLAPILLVLLGLLSQTRAQAGWWHGAVFYEIFVRSFQDSGTDGVGDLKGITSRLDYVKRLGADALWLTPIFASPSYHGYDAIDYRAINPEYGTLEDFKTLLREAHLRHLRIVLDLAVNHTADRNPWFGSREDWYLWADHPALPWIGKGHWNEVTPNRYYYSTFSKNMPDLNWHNPEVRKEVKGILHYWSQLGVDGFRLDAARYYVKGPEGEIDTPETHHAIEDFVQDLKRDYPQTMFVGEIWADAPTIASYLNSGRELDLAFNFPVAFGLKESLQKEEAAPFLASLKTMLSRVRSQKTLAPFITNHDMARIASDVQDNADKLKLAAAALLTLPGTPFVYYGEEIGLPNGPGTDDRGKRTPMQWTNDANCGFAPAGAKPWEDFSTRNEAVSVATQDTDPSSILAAYRKWIALRRSTGALRNGTLALLTASDSHVAGYAMSFGAERVVMALNFGARTAENVTLTSANGKRFFLGNLRPLSATLNRN